MFAVFSSRNRRSRGDAIDAVIEQVSRWPWVHVAPHQFDAVEFQLDGTEFGHIHRSGVLDVPFVRHVRDILVEDGAVEMHRWVPDSGWVTFEVRSMDDVSHAVYLLRLAYLYRNVNAGREDALELVHRDLDELDIPPRLVALFTRLVERRFHRTEQPS